MTSPELLLGIRKVLNETKQDKVCRTFCSKRGYSVHIPYLGSSTNPAYFFLGASPAGYDIADSPANAQEYIDWATEYFNDEQHDRASFQPYLPLTSNSTGDYQVFGANCTVAHMVPIVTPKSSDVTPSLIRNCWPRTRLMIEAIRPKLILCHGSATWKFLAGLEEGDERQFCELPEWLHLPISEIYEKVEADKIAFQSSWLGMDSEYRPWVVPLAHLAGATAGKESRKKAELAVAKARRAQTSPEGVVVSGARIRVRKAT
jgi:uracil-DNA glycosylase